MTYLVPKKTIGVVAIAFTLAACGGGSVSTTGSTKNADIRPGATPTAVSVTNE